MGAEKGGPVMRYGTAQEKNMTLAITPEVQYLLAMLAIIVASRTK